MENQYLISTMYPNNEEILNGVNYITFNNSMLFHFTKYQSALNILASNNLLFGSFEGMNDIAESCREVYCDSKYAEEELRRYKSISFTYDKSNKRPFEIDSLWGYYAEKGNGVCIAFDKSIILRKFRKLRCFHRRGRISYIRNFTNALFLEAKSKEDVVKEIEMKYKDIFFTKSQDWNKANEYRLLIKSESNGKECLDLKDSIKAVIICMPLQHNITETCEYKILSSITDVPILRYQTKLGNKTLTNIKTEKQLWPLLGIDYEVADRL